MSVAISSAIPPPLSNIAPPDSDTAPPQSAVPVWLATAASLMLVLALYIGARGTLLRLAIPAGATVIGLALYLRRPIAYVQFTIWMWFLTPLIRRVVDLRVGFEDKNLVLVAPLLVSMIASLSLLRTPRRPGSIRLTPFLLCIGGVLYGFVVGLVQKRLGGGDATLGELVFGLFNWLAPLLFGLHLYLCWPMYEAHKKAIYNTFLWGVLLLGLYAIYQYVAPPAWDVSWLEHMISDVGPESFGRPERYQIRVWSTLNSPGTFANMLMVGLVLLFFIRAHIKPVAAAAGYIAFLLTLVRTSWLAWIVAVAWLAKGAKGKQIGRILLSLVFLPVLLSPVLLIPDVSDLVQQRMETMMSLKEDASFQDRNQMYVALYDAAIQQPFGIGLRNQLTVRGFGVDSGILQMWFTLGPLGTLLYAFGLFAVVFGRKQGSPYLEDIVVFQAICVSLLAETVGGNETVGLAGVLLWSFAGMRMAAIASATHPVKELPATGGFGAPVTASSLEEHIVA